MKLSNALLLGLVFALPILQVLRFAWAGAWATAADLVAAAALGMAVADGVIDRVRGDGSTRGSGPGVGRLVGPVLAVAAWVALSGAWGHHPEYAAAKGLSVALWGGTAVALATGTIPTERWVRAWLYGVMATLLILSVFSGRTSL